MGTDFGFESGVTVEHIGNVSTGYGGDYLAGSNTWSSVPMSQSGGGCSLRETAVF
jgi:hypothetical protein